MSALDFGIGVDLGARTEDLYGDTYSYIYLSASLILRLDEVMEVTPTVYFYTIDDNIPADEAYTNFGAGCGLYFHLLRSEAVELSIGPKAMFYFYGQPESITVDEYSEFEVDLTISIILDVLFTKNIIMRLGIDAVDIYFYKYHTATGGVDFDDTVLGLRTYLGNPIGAARLGFCFMF